MQMNNKHETLQQNAYYSDEDNDYGIMTELQQSDRLQYTTCTLPLFPSSLPLCRPPTASSVDDSDAASPALLVCQ